MDEQLSSHHRDTLEKIFRHPTSGNIDWREVLSLLEYLGTTTEARNGKFKVTLGPETEQEQLIEAVEKDYSASTYSELSEARDRNQFAVLSALDSANHNNKEKPDWRTK